LVLNLAGRIPTKENERYKKQSIKEASPKRNFFTRQQKKEGEGEVTWDVRKLHGIPFRLAVFFV
jgi:hypothetical protein